MAGNGTSEGQARAELLQQTNAKHERLIQRDFDALPGSHPYGHEETHSEVTASPKGLNAKNIPRFAWWPISIGIGVAIILFAWAAVKLAIGY